jgi:plastocyanin
VYYQFVYLPEANKRPVVPENILHAAQSQSVTVVEGSSNPNQAKNFMPKQIKGTLGLSNKIVWKNEDSTAHSVMTDNGFEDKINGKFDSLATIGLIPPEGEFEFTFTEVGEFAYYCEPHPWMKGKVEIVENFA